MDIRKLAPGDRVLDYRILERLGEGGFGEVFRAEHEVLGRIVAIKVPRDQTGLTALRHEGVVQASLDHPNIVRTLELSISHDPPYVVMEYVDGMSLAEILRREGPVSWRRASRILLEAAKALDYAHGRGVVHGDVKPGNILVAPGRKGRVFLTDFGLGRVFEGPQGNLQISRSLELATSGAEVQGTIRYIAPELLRGETADERADLYSFGVLLFEVLTGRLPEGREVPSDLNGDLPPEFDRLFARTFTRRERRPRSFEGTIADLTALLEGKAKTHQAAPPRVKATPAAPKVVRAIPAEPASNGGAAADRGSHHQEPEVKARHQAPVLPIARTPALQRRRDLLIAGITDRLSVRGLSVGEGHGFDVCYGVNNEGEPHHRVYALVVDALDAETARSTVATARRIFEREKGIWEKEVTFCLLAGQVEEREQVLWTLKSFSMGWWRRRRMILHDLGADRIYASELGCDPQGNPLKRAFLAASREAVAALPAEEEPTPGLEPSRAMRRCARGTAWGATLALVMSFGVLGSFTAMQCASRSLRCKAGADGPGFVAGPQDVDRVTIVPAAPADELLRDVLNLLEANPSSSVSFLADTLDRPEGAVKAALTTLVQEGRAPALLDHDAAERDPVPPPAPEAFTPSEPRGEELFY